MPQPFKSTNLYQTVRGKQLCWFTTVCPRPAPQQCSKFCQSWASSIGSPSKEMSTTHLQWPQSKWLIKIIHHDTSGQVRQRGPGFKSCRSLAVHHTKWCAKYNMIICVLVWCLSSFSMGMIYQDNIHLGTRICCIHINWASEWKAPALRTSLILCWCQELPQR